MSAITRPAWSPERRARELMARREEFVRTLPKRIRAARGLAREVHEQIIDDSITFTAVRHKKPIESADDLMRVFWHAVELRVKQARDGRHELVRARYEQVDMGALEDAAVEERAGVLE